MRLVPNVFLCVVTLYSAGLHAAQSKPGRRDRRVEMPAQSSAQLPAAARAWLKRLPDRNALEAMVRGNAWVAHPQLKGLEFIKLAPDQGMLYRVGPGVALPSHEHTGVEGSIMLQGGFELRRAVVDETGAIAAGKVRRYQSFAKRAVLWREPGTADVDQRGGRAGATILVWSASPTKPVAWPAAK